MKGNNFFDAFDFFTDDDPTHGWKNMLHFLIIIYFLFVVYSCVMIVGYVDFVSRSEAERLGLVNVTSDNKVRVYSL